MSCIVEMTWAPYVGKDLWCNLLISYWLVLTNIWTESFIWWQNKHSQKLMTLVWWPGVFMRGSNWLEMTVLFFSKGTASLCDGQTLTVFLLTWHTWYSCQFPLWAVYFSHYDFSRKGHLPEVEWELTELILPSSREFNRAPTQRL